VRFDFEDLEISFHPPFAPTMLSLKIRQSLCRGAPRYSPQFFSSSSSSSSPDAASAAECDRLVKLYDYENYMCSLFLPPDVRRSILALRAYNVELATVRDATRGNALTGRLRFQFWKDTLDRACSTTPTDTRVDFSSPVQRSLYDAVQAHGLNQRFLNRLLVAREKELENEELSDMGDFEEYAEAVGSSLMYLSLQCQGIVDTDNAKTATAVIDDNAYRAAGHVGRAIGMVTMLRSVPMTAENSQRFTLPFWVMSGHGVTREEFLTGVSTPQMQDCILEAATAANNQLLDAKDMQDKGELSKQAANALLPAALAEDFLVRLEHVEFDIFHPSLVRTKWDNVKFMMRLYSLQNAGKIL
jgi:NADH dehydrogenase [ubiquinone] 1 alpha subcomplex assembly factor 6